MKRLIVGALVLGSVALVGCGDDTSEERTEEFGNALTCETTKMIARADGIVTWDEQDDIDRDCDR